MRTAMKRCLFTFAAGLVALAGGPSFSQEYPARPVAVILPLPPGGAVEGWLRSVLQEASRSLGQSLVPENRPGAGSRVGADALVRAAADGYTLGLIGSPNAVNGPLMDPGYRMTSGKEFTPIVLLQELVLVVVSNPSLPFRDLAGFVAYARANPGKLQYPSHGMGSSTHLGGELLARQLGLDIVHVPYKGEVQAMGDFVGNQVTGVYFASAGTRLKPLIASGKIIALATTGGRRWSAFPELPTLAESLHRDLVVTSWGGLAGPGGLAPEVVAKVNRAFNVALQVPDIRARAESLGLIVLGGGAGDFEQLVRSDLQRWEKVIKTANIRLQ